MNLCPKIANLLGLLTVLTGLTASVVAAAPIELTAPDGRTVRLNDDQTWEYVESAAGSVPQVLTLRLERKIDAPRGCGFGMRLINGASYKVVSLIPRVSAFDNRDVRFDTVYVAYSGIKPTLEQYREFHFKGIPCAEIARLKLHGGDRCNMGDLDRFIAEKGVCLARIRLEPSDVFPMAK